MSPFLSEKAKYNDWDWTARNGTVTELLDEMFKFLGPIHPKAAEAT